MSRIIADGDEAHRLELPSLATDGVAIVAAQFVGAAAERHVRWDRRTGETLERLDTRQPRPAPP